LGIGRRADRGKIQQVFAAVRQVEAAIRRDFIAVGREFDDGSLCWDDLHALIFAAPPGTAVFHAFEQGWTTTDYLLAHVIDGVRIGNWQQTDGARKRPPRNVPDPFPRPSDLAKSQHKPAAGDTTMVGDSVATVTTVDDFLARRAELEQRWRDRQQHKRGGG